MNLDNQLKLTFKTNKRSRSVSIKILNDNSVLVTRPPHVSLSYAERFLEQHKAEILKRVNANKIETFKTDTLYKSKFFEFTISKSQNHKHSQRTLNNRLNIKIASDIDTESEEAQDYIQSSILNLLKKEAKQYLPNRIFELANHCGLKFNNIKINSAKTRWGSCNQKNDINLSCYLMLLPYHLIDYILLHELAHTIHKNHSASFYQLLDQLVNGKHLLLNRELKKNRLLIHPLYFQKSVF